MRQREWTCSYRLRWRNPARLQIRVCRSDDTIATVGTINLDYRSLYLHFENGTYLQGSKKVMDIKKDISRFLAENNIPVNLMPKKDVMDKTEVKASDILLGKTNDKQLNNMSSIFPRSTSDSSTKDLF